SPFSLNTYFNPSKFTIPQYNFRLGYYLKEHWDISFGIDHMKYVVRQNQVTEISGYIHKPESIYDGDYEKNELLLVEDFLKFEHTDGLNYINIELRHFNKLMDIGKIEISLKEGFGAGLLLPRTNTTLLENVRYDEFHLSGYGISGILGVNLTFLHHFFVQSEIKGGFINLTDVRTTNSKTDKANHSFFFSQINIVFGANINLKPKTKVDKI
ncbi:MAG: hypothetical protein WAT79_16235, partial [Saprospiraceae bacterium]